MDENEMRDAFAMAAVAGFIASGKVLPQFNGIGNHAEAIGKSAYAVADAMIEERKEWLKTTG